MQKPVTIYTTPTCGYCRATKDFFKAGGVTYNEIDVAANQAKAREMIEKSGQMGVPVIVVGEGNEEKVIVGFNRNALSEALGL